MSGTEIAALIAALAFVLLVGVLLVPILKLRRTVDAATRAMTALADGTGPLVADAHRAVDGMNSAIEQLHTSLDGVNSQLERLDVISRHAEQVSGDVAKLSTIVTGATTGPLVKAAALGYGVRKGVTARRRSTAGRGATTGLTAESKRSGKTRRAGKGGLFRRAARHAGTAVAAREGKG